MMAEALAVKEAYGGHFPNASSSEPAVLLVQLTCARDASRGETTS